MTNFEKIKSMNKEQMTDFIFHALYDDICDYCKKWLESEALESEAEE